MCQINCANNIFTTQCRASVVYSKYLIVCAGGLNLAPWSVLKRNQREREEH